MKKLILMAALIFAFASCTDDTKEAGNPQLDVLTDFASAHFADSLAFAARVSDASVPLSTLKAQLYFNDEVVAEKVIRTKTDGEYSGKLYIPFKANIPNGEATLKLVLQNIHFTVAEETFSINVSRPDYPSLTLVLEDGTELGMDRKSLYNYEVTGEFPAKQKAYIVAPAFGSAGNELTFGMENGTIVEGSKTLIGFSEAQAGEYTIAFNTQTYAASPFVVVKVNGAELTVLDDTRNAGVVNLTQGAEMTFDGIPDVADWWMDPSFFEKDGDVYKFRAIDGYYKFTADFGLKYFRIEACNADGSLATLAADGSGALWIIGDDIGFPNLTNETGWTTEKGICMAQIEPRKYQVILKATNKSVDRAAGQVHSLGINFKFFHQRDWGGEFGGTSAASSATSTSDIVLINAADGNLKLAPDVTLTEGATYVFTVDVASSASAVLSVEEQ